MNLKWNISRIVILIFLSTGCMSEARAEEKILPEFNFKLIAPNVYLFQDICNVFVIKSGTSALLIDSGSGNVTDYLQNIGVEKIEWVLHTHYHRDQSIGSRDIRHSGAKIGIGELESELLNTPGVTPPFKSPEKFLLNGELPGWGTRMALFNTPGVDKELKNGEVFNWNGYDFTVVDTPGHTKGSISIFTEINGQKLGFTGDLIMEGGHVRDLYSMQWIYLQNPGIDSSIVSLDRIKKLKPHVLLPSHGAVIKTPHNDIDLLSERLMKVQNAFNYQRSGRWNWSQFIQVSEHVVQDGGSTSQIIISDSGKALLFDCGKEFSPERLKEAKAKFGIRKIDVIIPSHWHFDHVDGIEALVKSEGAEVWAWEGLAEHLTHPERFPATCWTGSSIHIDRVLKEGETFSWGGYPFKVLHHPVHTEQQMALTVKIDGLDFYLLADGTGYTKNGNIRSPIHCYNGISLSSGLIKTAQSFISANPYICLPAHSNVFAVAPNDKYEYFNWSVETSDAIRSILCPPCQDLGFDPYWASFYPVRVKLKAGQEARTFLRLKNYSGKTISGKYKIKSYGDVVYKNDIINYELDAGETKDFPVEIKMGNSAENGIYVITADIDFDGQVFGEYPQAYIELDE